MALPADEKPSGPREPRWRVFLCWAAVITFFLYPLTIFTLRVVSMEVSWLHLDERWEEFKNLGTYFHTVAALVFGLAGLNSWDRSRNGKNGK